MCTEKRVLIVDDKTLLLEMLSEQLQLHQEFVPSVATSGAEALKLTKKKCFDVIILNVSLPDIDGREVCRSMRSGGIKSPIIMLAGVDTDADVILSFNVGANDHITKPFRFVVLLAKMRTHIRQHEHSDNKVLTIGPYSFQPGAQLLLEKETNKKVRLTEKETAILKYLYQVGDNVVGRDVLLDKVWGYNAEVTTHTLETHLYRLRQKIEENPCDARILLTEPGGYRLAP
jgi:DNA-binding response OmpR family regulator